MHGRDGFDCRIYAPVGSHKELLAYLVRRLLENGANSSFVNAVNDPDVPIESLLVPPAASFAGGASPRHAGIALPARLFGERKNSRGMEFGSRADLEALMPRHRGGAASDRRRAHAARSAGEAACQAARRRQMHVSRRPSATVVGTVAEADAAHRRRRRSRRRVAGFARLGRNAGRRARRGARARRRPDRGATATA